MAQRARQGFTWHRLLLVVLAVASVSIFALAGLTMLWKSRPDYWVHNQQLRALDNATLMQMSSQLEHHLLRELSGSPQDTAATRTLVVSFEDINAWLSVKLEDYLANRHLKLPESIQSPMFAGSETGQLMLAFEHQSDSVSQVISIVLQPSFSSDGKQFQLKLTQARTGAIPLPVSAVRKQLLANAGDQGPLRQVVDILDGQWIEAVQSHPGDARQNLRLTGMQITPQTLTLTLQSEPRLLRVAPQDQP